MNPPKRALPPPAWWTTTVLLVAVLSAGLLVLTPQAQATELLGNPASVKQVVAGSGEDVIRR